jgi:hypothetical protein
VVSPTEREEYRLDKSSCRKREGSREKRSCARVLDWGLEVVYCAKVRVKRLE